MIAAIGSVMRTSAPRAPLPAVDPADPDELNVEPGVEPEPLLFAPVEHAIPETGEASLESGMGDHRPFSEIRAAQVGRVGGEPALFAPPAMARPNASFATAFDPSPAQTPVGREAATASASTPLALARTLSAYGAMRGA
jgi:hypothetical protein